jgi:DNA-binding PadR family transcriptional regulator
MPLSKLDKYLKVLEVLVERPQELDKVASRTRMKRRELKQRLDFLLLNGVIEERVFNDDRVVYAVNDRGLAVFKTLRAFKYFEKLKDTLPVIEEAREIASLLSKHSKEWKEE